jgi:hypothetical protein
MPIELNTYNGKAGGCRLESKVLAGFERFHCEGSKLCILSNAFRKVRHK